MKRSSFSASGKKPNQSFGERVVSMSFFFMASSSTTSAAPAHPHLPVLLVDEADFDAMFFLDLSNLSRPRMTGDENTQITLQKRANGANLWRSIHTDRSQVPVNAAANYALDRSSSLVIENSLFHADSLTRVCCFRSSSILSNLALLTEARVHAGCQASDNGQTNVKCERHSRIGRHCSRCHVLPPDT